MKKIILITAIITQCFGSAYAAKDIDQPHITVTGTYITEVAPDKMEWSLRLKNTGKDLSSVAEQHVEIVNNVKRSKASAIRELVVHEIH